MRSLLPQQTKTLPDTLAISGGGMRGIHGLGALAQLRRRGVLRDVRHVVGTSSGAILGLMLATDQLERGLGIVLRQKPMRDIRLDKLSSSFGIDSGRSLDNLLEKLGGGSQGLTFQQLLDASGIDFHVCATNLSKRRAEYFCAASTPTMSVVEAVRHSCTIPGLFAVKRAATTTDVYVDGGLLANFPMARARDVSPTGRILGLTYCQSADVAIRDARTFMAAILETMMMQDTACAKPSPLEHMLCLESEPIALDFDADARTRLRWFYKGARQARDFLKKIE